MSTDDTVSRIGGVYHDWLTVNVPAAELKGRREFDIHLTLRSTSGVESGPKPCATFIALRVRAR